MFEEYGWDSQSFGMVVAIVGVVGFVVFGWRYGAVEGTVPSVLGLVFGAVAVGYALVRMSR